MSMLIVIFFFHKEFTFSSKLNPRFRSPLENIPVLARIAICFNDIILQFIMCQKAIKISQILPDHLN